VSVHPTSAVNNVDMGKKYRCVFCTPVGYTGGPWISSRWMQQLCDGWYVSLSWLWSWAWNGRCPLELRFNQNLSTPRRISSFLAQDQLVSASTAAPVNLSR